MTVIDFSHASDWHKLQIEVRQNARIAHDLCRNLSVSQCVTVLSQVRLFKKGILGSAGTPQSGAHFTICGGGRISQHALSHIS